MLESDIIQTASTILTNDVSLSLAVAYNKIYLHPYEVFLRSRTRLSNLVNDQLLGDFIGPLPSTKHATESDEGTKASTTQSGSRRGRSAPLVPVTTTQNPSGITATGDWIITINNTCLKEFRVPCGVPNFCMKFAFRGGICNRTNCHYRHMGKDQFILEEKSLLESYITSNAGKFQYA